MTTAIMEKPPTEGEQEQEYCFWEEDDPRWAFMNPIQNSEATHNKQYR